MAHMTGEELSLDEFDRFPDGLATIELENLNRVLVNPTLLSITGEKDPPLFLSTLLHGNETSSFTLLQELAQRYADRPPSRSLLIFVGNPAAAAAGVRYLPGQADFNRIWGGGEGPHHRIADRVMERARRAAIYASIDIHNNTGDNPIYGCVNALRPVDLYLASLFSDIGVFYLNPPTTQSIAFSHLAPAITVECGRSGDSAGLAAARNLIDVVMDGDVLAAPPRAARPTSIYQTIGRVTVNQECDVGFGDPTTTVNLRPDIETMNFKPMPKGAPWGATRRTDAIAVVNEHGGDITDDFFVIDDGVIRSTRAVTPSMITTDLSVIQQDCLCYLMTKIDL